MCQEKRKVFFSLKNSLIKILSCSFSHKIHTKFPSDCKVSTKLLEFPKLYVQYEVHFKTKRSLGTEVEDFQYPIKWQTTNNNKITGETPEVCSDKRKPGQPDIVSH